MTLAKPMELLAWELRQPKLECCDLGTAIIWSPLITVLITSLWACWTLTYSSLLISTSSDLAVHLQISEYNSPTLNWILDHSYFAHCELKFEMWLTRISSQSLKPSMSEMENTKTSETSKRAPKILLYLWNWIQKRIQQKEKLIFREYMFSCWCPRPQKKTEKCQFCECMDDEK